MPAEMKAGVEETVTITGKNPKGATIELPVGSTGVTVSVTENTNEQLVFRITAAVAKLGAGKLIVSHFGEKAGVAFETKQ